MPVCASNSPTGDRSGPPERATVELYDLESDALERNNLATDRAQNAELIEAMNAKLNALIGTEVGEDVEQMLPGGVDGGWVVSDAVYDV